MQYSAFQIKEILNSGLELANPDAALQNIGFDSRRIHRASVTLFFALEGKSRSGTQYVHEAYLKGVRNFVVPEGFDPGPIADSNFFMVKNVQQSLQMLAAFHRKKITVPVIAITGSNGKTIVKEWLYHLLQHDFKIARSPRSYNSALGASISILGVEKWHEMAILEAGISMPGEMDAMQEMMQPNMGIFTHLGSAHEEHFESRKQKAAEKMKLFRHCDVLVFPFDTAEIREAVHSLKSTSPLLKTYSWGWSEGATFCIQNVNTEQTKTTIHFVHRSVVHEVQIPFTDHASIENAMSCLCALTALERWDPAHVEAFMDLQPLENRLVFAEGKNGNYIVNDSYSNDLDSLEVALDFLLRQQPGMPHLVVLSDLQQSAQDKKGLYEKVAALLLDKNTAQLVAVGKEIAENKEVFHQIPAQFFEDTESLLRSDWLDEVQGKAILVKGSRSFRMERISEKMRKQLHKTVLEIDLTSLRNNVTFFRNQTKPGVKLMAMVKAFGYGSGSFEAARTLQFMGADYFAVAYADEGVQLRKSGIYVPIMVMNTGIDDLHALLEYQLEPVVYNREGLEDFCRQKSNIGIHIELDTGMHRLGFDPALDVAQLGAIPYPIKVKSVFSHLAASEAAEHDAFTRRQIQIFNDACKKWETFLGYSFTKHIANTGGILRFPEAHLDMVRLGIGMYGVDPSGAGLSELETVVSLKTSISQVKQIHAGESIGYGRRAIEQRDRKIAILPIGYADGLWRKLGNGNGYALIHGKKAPYLGSICMDMAMCDVTEIACSEGDEVEIFGKHISVNTLAEQCDTIAYEILTSISPRVRREYIGEN